MTRGLLVDLGNVLVRFDHGRTLRRLAEATGVSPERLRPALFGDLEAAFDRGETSAAEFFRAAEARAGLPRLPDEVWVPAWRDIFEPDPEALGLLDRLRPGVRTALISNTNELHWQGVLRVCDVDRKVDALALSFRLGVAKPDPRHFRLALEAIGLTAGEAAYADDREELVASARELLGLDAFLVRSARDLREGLAARSLLRDDPPTGNLRPPV